MSLQIRRQFPQWNNRESIFQDQFLLLRLFLKNIKKLYWKTDEQEMHDKKKIETNSQDCTFRDTKKNNGTAQSVVQKVI